MTPAPRDYRLGVGIMLINGAGEVLVARRADMPGAEAWQMPQGGIGPGESPREAAMRELKEEIGTDKAEILAESSWLRYDLPRKIAGTVWGGRYRGQKQKWFAMRFLGREADIDLKTPHPEFDAWKWVRPERLPELIVAFKRPLYRDLLAAFRDYLEGEPRAGATGREQAGSPAG
jgi:putative (di)nucleoside polyphosphate hydrolase